METCQLVSPPASKPKFPFFSLARELRDEIYHLLFLDTSLRIHKNHHIISIRYSTPIHPHSRCPAWLLTSKATLSEGLAQFSRHAVCINIRPAPGEHESFFSSFMSQTHHDTLLLPNVQKIQLTLGARFDYNNHDYANIIGKTASFVLLTLERARDCRKTSVPVPFDFRTRELLPALERLVLKIEVETNSWKGSPNSVDVCAMGLRALGVRFKHVRIEMLPPKIESWEKRVAAVAIVAAMYPRFQQMMHNLACLFTRGYDADADEKTKTEVDEAYWERKIWFFEESSTMSEAESAARRFEVLSTRDRMRTVKEWWTDEENGAWNVEITQASRARDGPYVSEARGLKSFTAPISGADERADWWTCYANDVVKLDEVAKRGVVSYSCASTGRLFWIEHGRKGVTGYRGREGGEENFHKPSTVNGFLCEPEKAIVRFEPESDRMEN